MMLLGAWLSLASLAAAETLTGTVKNGTTGKPSAGDDVVLLQLSQGMQEAARTKTDAAGKFSFTYTADGGPHLVRVNHQNVNYFKMAPPGVSSADVEVFNAAEKVSGIHEEADVMKVQADGGTIQFAELFAVKNDSNPPRTQMNDHNFEFYLPEGAQIDSGAALGPGGQPVQSAPVPQTEKNKYAFVFPIRPGQTQFRVIYHLPYSGQITLKEKFTIPMQHFVIEVPKSMQVQPTGTDFQPIQADPNSTALVASNVGPDTAMSLAISGTGQMVEEGEQSASGGGGGGGGPAAATNRPGGGMGTPIDTPDPLYKYRWYIAGGLGLAMVIGAVYVAKRPPEKTAARSAEIEEPEEEVEEAPRPKSSSKLLDALKEELFELEIDRQQGNISQEEYESAKAALDQTIKHALSRQQVKR